MGILTMIVIGLVAGLIARAIVPGRQSMGVLATMLLGIVGSFVGGLPRPPRSSCIRAEEVGTGPIPGQPPTLVPRWVCERTSPIIMFTMYFGPTEPPFVGRFRTVPDTTNAPEDMATWRPSPRTGSLPKEGSRTRPLTEGVS